jgi:integrase
LSRFENAVGVKELYRAGEFLAESVIRRHAQRLRRRAYRVTPIAVQQKLMRHADIRTTMNTYGDVVTDEMSRAASKVAGLALNGAQAERKAS